jgi:hypothetical protein
LEPNLRKLAIIDKNPDAKYTQWRAAPNPKKFFHRDSCLVPDIKKYKPNFIFINKGNTFQNIETAILGYKSLYFYGDYYQPIPNYVRHYGAMCSVVLLTNKNKDVWRSIKNKNIFFISQGVDIDIFKPIQIEKKYDIVFGGNYHGTKFCGSNIRLQFVRRVKQFGLNFKVIGDGWPDDIKAIQKQGVHDYNKTMNQAQITIGMSHFVNVPYYTSNRLYQCMATGVPHIAWYSPGIKNLFKQGYLEIGACDQLKVLVDTFLSSPAMSKETGRKQRDEIVKRHTIFHSWTQIEKIMGSL